MVRHRKSGVIGRALTVFLFGTIGALAQSPAARTVGWADLRPAEQSPYFAIARDAPIEGSGVVLAEGLADQTVRIHGYVLPVDQEGDQVYEFLLVPWQGACSHTGQPPPNQLIHVLPNEPVRISKIYEGVAVSGVLQPELEKTQLFILDGPRVLTSGYSIATAAVTITKMPDRTLRLGTHPASGK